MCFGKNLKIIEIFFAGPIHFGIAETLEDSFRCRSRLEDLSVLLLDLVDLGAAEDDALVVRTEAELGAVGVEPGSGVL